MAGGGSGDKEKTFKLIYLCADGNNLVKRGTINNTGERGELLE